MLTINRKSCFAFRLIYGALLLALLWAVLRCLAAGPVFAGTLDTILNHSKISNPEPIRQAFKEADATAKVIVHYRHPESLSGSEPLDTDPRREAVRDRIRTARDGFVKEIENDGIRSADVRVKREFDYIPAVAATVSTSGLKALLDREDVEHVEPDLILHAHTAQGIPLMQATEVRSVYGGSGIAIAICDTGIDYTHFCLGASDDAMDFPNDKVIGGTDFGDDDAYPMDTNGHGTSCAGIAAGDANASGNYIGGVAPDAKLYAVKITTGSTGSASTSDMIAAWQWCVTHQDDDPANPIMIISTSFGGDGFSGSCDNASMAMTMAAAAAVRAGITLFASSGNDGYCGQIAWPACISNVVSVAAVYDTDFTANVTWCVSSESCADNLSTNSSCTTGYAAKDITPVADQVAPFSNVSESLDLFAPSYKTATTAVGGGFVTSFAGTSAACPYAAGIAAVIQSAVKEAGSDFLTPTQVKARLSDYGASITYDAAGITKPRPDLYATDIDDDGMPAGWEINYFASISRDGSGDYDADGLTDLAEYQAETYPDDSDSDDDGMSDGDEAANGTDPLDEDSDDDGYSDGEEAEAGTDPLASDSYPIAIAVGASGPFSLFATALLLLGLVFSAKTRRWHDVNKLKTGPVIPETEAAPAGRRT
ncbi:S8 family serine peptidase [uncultured Desulfosarcina sp.]|uniref:S8 family peptidase n=1 Tax=uncultured Desulfosarcina sp. TaxID=218289 RepID=UPI0029C7BB00|nr:S8 family serine peptidase [uncultured Desulfosarcina sp.]